VHFAIPASSAIFPEAPPVVLQAFGRARSRVSEVTRTITSSLSISIRPTDAPLHENMLNSSTIQQREGRS